MVFIFKIKTHKILGFLFLWSTFFTSMF